MVGRLGEYWEDTIVCGDCLDVMAQLPDGCVDLVFLDPPFNKGKDYGNYDDRRDDYWEWVELWFILVTRILKTDSSLYFMHITDGLWNVLALVNQMGFELQNVIPWKNTASVHTKRKFIRSYQPIVFATRGNYYFNTYFETNPRAIKSWSNERRQRQRGQLLDIWDDISRVYAGSVVHKEAILEPGTKRKAHLCQAPIKLLRRVIGFSCPLEGVVFDPFMGSGTTAVAAKRLGRHWFGCDINPDYVEMACQRVAQAMSPLFVMC